MTAAGVQEYIEAIRGRYVGAGKTEKGRILDEAVRVTGYHRKAVVRLVGRRQNSGSPYRRGRPRRYGLELAQALKVLWEASGRVCSRRLHPFVPELIGVLRRHGEQQLTREAEAQLVEMSPSTIDRLLEPIRRRDGRRRFSTTKPGTLLRDSIPIRTFADWNNEGPGFLEIDLVAHCGESTEGLYLHTLSTVDIATGWVECQGVWGKGQDRVGSAIHHIAQRLPFRLLGLDSDNGSEFINHHLVAYCERKHITFTRAPPYKKNDSAHVEQKNWTVVRQLVGYDRYSSRASLETLNRLYGLVRWHTNFFQPVMKLQHKTRHGAKVHKIYDRARTPYQRLLDSGALSQDQQRRLAATYARLNPIKLRSQIDDTLSRLWALSDALNKSSRSQRPLVTA